MIKIVLFGPGNTETDKKNRIIMPSDGSKYIRESET